MKKVILLAVIAACVVSSSVKCLVFGPEKIEQTLMRASGK